jgi:hypothetical protein
MNQGLTPAAPLCRGPSREESQDQDQNSERI